MNKILLLIVGLFLVFPKNTYAQNSKAPILTKKIIVFNFDPILESQGNRRLSNYLNWNNPNTLVQGYIDALYEASQGVVDYQIAEFINIDAIPTKKDGFTYTDETYLGCWNNRSTCHSPDEVDYLKILRDYNVCERRNSDEIHEAWLMGGPYFGYWEAIMAGPNGFWTNGGPLSGTTCTKQLHIMGFNYERGVQQMVHNMGHRVEGTMTHLFGGWQQNRTANDWERFALVDAQSPNYNYSGCGSVHYPPNGVSDYDYTNLTPNESTCLDWLNYPNLTGVRTQINCSAWNCGNYEAWWLSFLPRYTGQTNGKWNNWWYYVLDFETALVSPQPTNSPTSTPSSTPSVPGDGNNDGKVDGLDYLIWLNNYNTVALGSQNGDYDNSNFIDGLDYLVWLNNYSY